eukprot:9273_1
MFAPLPIKPDINSLLFFCHVLNGNAICRASIQHNPLIKPILTKSESVGNSTICPQIISNVEETLALIFVYFISTIISIKSILKSVSCLSISYKTQLLTVGEIPFNMKLTQSKDIKQTKRLESTDFVRLFDGTNSINIPTCIAQNITKILKWFMFTSTITIQCMLLSYCLFPERTQFVITPKSWVYKSLDIQLRPPLFEYFFTRMEIDQENMETSSTQIKEGIKFE